MTDNLFVNVEKCRRINQIRKILGNGTVTRTIRILHAYNYVTRKNNSTLRTYDVIRTYKQCVTTEEVIFKCSTIEELAMDKS